MKINIEFNIGDFVHCHYHNIRGVITKINNPYIKIEYGENLECVTSLRTKSANTPYPVYLQMICTKSDSECIIPEVLNLTNP